MIDDDTNFIFGNESRCCIYVYMCYKYMYIHVYKQRLTKFVFQGIQEKFKNMWKN